MSKLMLVNLQEAAKAIYSPLKIALINAIITPIKLAVKS